MTVPFLDLKRSNGPLEAELTAAFSRVLRSGHYILGPEVADFERRCADYLGVKHAIGVSSGSDALIVSLMALGIEPGDEVICPCYTFFATVGAIVRCHAKPVFVDIRLDDFNCAADAVAARVTSKTKAIIPVHLYGQMAEMDPLVEVAKQHRLAIIEDAAQAFGARYRDRGAGSIGDVGCFSFFPSKNLPAMGDAGLVTTQDESLATRIRVLRAHGAQVKYHHEMVGGNFRLDALQAALIGVKLNHTDGYAEKRQANAQLYQRHFEKGGIAAPNDGDIDSAAALLYPKTLQQRHVFNQYVIRVPNRRDALLSYLRSKKVGAQVYYPEPLHVQPCFAELGYREGDFPHAERAAKETLALPIFPELEENEIELVVEHVTAFLRSDD